MLYENEDVLSEEVQLIVELKLATIYKTIRLNERPRINTKYSGFVLKYLRDFHQIFISIYFDDYKWSGEIYYAHPLTNKLVDGHYDYNYEQSFDTYEACVEFLIIKALKKI